jgi:hypothetical protein
MLDSCSSTSCWFHGSRIREKLTVLKQKFVSQGWQQRHVSNPFRLSSPSLLCMQSAPDSPSTHESVSRPVPPAGIKSRHQGADFYFETSNHVCCSERCIQYEDPGVDWWQGFRSHRMQVSTHRAQRRSQQVAIVTSPLHAIAD